MKRLFGKVEIGLLFITLAYAAGGYTLAAHLGLRDHFSLFMYSKAAGLATFFLALGFIAARIFYIMIKRRPARLTRFIIDDFKTFLCGGDRLLRAVPVFLCFLVFMSVFTSLKMLIPAVHPYSWDPLFSVWDNLLHGGRDPWRILHPLFGHPPVTTAVNFVYNMWFFVMFGALYWQLFALKDTALRARFFYSFFLSWIINGTLAAMVFSSAGPCFYKEIAGGDYYQQLMDYLHRAAEQGPVWALRTQQMLLESYQDNTLGIGAGISAMPSMHISIAFIIALTGWKTSRTLGVAFTLFALTIMVGTVHLAWHYALDGYFSLLTTWLIWRFCGWLAARLDK